MKIGDTFFETSLIEILTELQAQLKANQIPLISVIKDAGDDVMITCPYHKNGQENKPSMGVRKADGLCHCFTCGTTTSLPELISFCFGKDKTDLFGWNWLLKNFLTIAANQRKLNFKFDGLRTTRTEKPPEYVSEEELDTYRYTHPYWTKRKITDDDLIELFDLGYDKKTDCITMPVRDKNGNCLFVARRSVHTKYFNYPSGSEKPVYGLYELSRQPKFPNEVIVCESIIDALTAWQYGKYAVALNGTGTKRQYQELTEMPCRKLILATDADSAGMKAREKLRANVKGKIITEYIWDLDQAKDLNDMEKPYFDSLSEVF